MFSSRRILSNFLFRDPRKNMRIHPLSKRYRSSEKNYRFDMTDDKNNFRNYFPEIKAKVMTEYCEIVKDEIEIAHFEKYLDYNLTFQARTCSQMMMQLYRILENVPGRSTTSLGNSDLYTIGWLIEMLIRPVPILDDMVDHSTLRRGVPCWYLLEDNAKKLPADNLKISLVALRLLERQFKHRPFYENVAELLYKETLMANISVTITLGNRILDGTDKIPGAFKNLCFYKSGFYLKMPIYTAIYLAGYQNELDMEKLSGIILDLSCIFVAANDRDDTYGVALNDGKRCTPAYEDLKLGRVNWFLEEALLRGNAQQKEIVKKYYGRDDFDSNQKIINVFNELGLLEKFDLYAEEIYANLMKQAKNFPSYFVTYIDEIYKLMAYNPESLGKLDKKELLKYQAN